MKDAQGRNMVRLHDRTDHGGVVIEAASDLKHMGIAVALNGHLVQCPKCKGSFPIIASGPRQHHGRLVAFVGDKTTCGATLVSS